jgi:cholesterol transport system auxiliary component
MRQARFLLAVAAPLSAALALSACSLGGKTPSVLMRLSADAPAAASAGRSGQAAEAITVVVPTVPAELRTPRVPVRTGATAVAYLENAQWVEMPAELFARLLTETISSRTGRVVLDPKQFTFDPGQRLTGTLQAFGLQADRSEAVVIYDAAIARGANRVETRRFEAHVPVSTIDPTTAPEALNRAANQVAAEVAAWVG